MTIAKISLSRAKKIEVLTEWIASVVPGVMELKHGCMVNVAGCPNGCCGYEEGWIIDSSMDVKGNKITHKIFKDVFYIMEVFGRPVTIADVIICLIKISNDIDNNYRLFVKFTTGGKIIFKDIDPNRYVGWDLSQDRLSSQSDEFIDWLMGLMGLMG